jgi:hypothetical protein
VANEQNLRPKPPWKPGESGNPGGSSKKMRFTAALKRKLRADPKLLADEFIAAGWKAAMDGDFNFWKYLYERVDGPMPKDEPEPELTAEAIAEMQEIDANLDESESVDPPETPGQVPQ